MRLGGIRTALALTLGATMGACSGSAPDADDANVQANAPAAPVGTPANLIEDPQLPDLAANQTVEASPCPNAPGSMCIGPLVVRAEGLTLLADGSASSSGSRNLVAQSNLVFENRTSSPIRLAILAQPMDILFDNGIRLAVNRRNAVTGVFRCEQRDAAECFQGVPERFQTLTPGDSPARASISFHGGMDGSLAASLPSVATGTITLQVYVVGADNVGSVLNISVPNAQVRNQLRQ